MTLDKERLRVLAEAATPGPWILLPVEDGSPYLRVRGTRLGARYKVANVLAPTYFMPRDGIESTANAEFIAAARDAVPALLAENAALAAEVERLRKSPLLAERHTGMRVDYSGLLGQCQRALRSREPGNAEMLRQLQGHLQELGRRWYEGDTAVVDEILQLYCIERDARAAMADKGGAAS